MLPGVASITRGSPIVMSLAEVRCLDLPTDADVYAPRTDADITWSDSGSDSGSDAARARGTTLACAVCCIEGSAMVLPCDLTRNLGPRVLAARHHVRRRGTVLANDVVVAAPCGVLDHSMCARCVRVAAMTNPRRAATCLATHDRDASCTRAFVDEDLAAILTNGDRDVIAACTRVDAACGACGAHGEAIGALSDPTGAGGVVRCKSAACGARTCFTCGVDVGSRPRVDAHVCAAAPGAWVPYLPSPVRTGSAPYARRFEVTDETVRTFVRTVTEDELGTVKCTLCAVPLCKTTDCNAISHCDIEHCWACGMASLPGHPLPATHWHTCPRYDDDEMWSQWNLVGFQCRGGVCHDDVRDCAEESHAAGRASMLAARVRRRCHALLAAVPDVAGPYMPRDSAMIYAATAAWMF